MKLTWDLFFTVAGYFLIYAGFVVGVFGDDGIGAFAVANGLFALYNRDRDRARRRNANVSVTFGCDG